MKLSINKIIYCLLKLFVNYFLYTLEKMWNIILPDIYCQTNLAWVVVSSSAVKTVFQLYLENVCHVDFKSVRINLHKQRKQSIKYQDLGIATLTCLYYTQFFNNTQWSWYCYYQLFCQHHDLCIKKLARRGKLHLQTPRNNAFRGLFKSFS